MALEKATQIFKNLLRVCSHCVALFVFEPTCLCHEKNSKQLIFRQKVGIRDLL